MFKAKTFHQISDALRDFDQKKIVYQNCL